MSWKLNPPNTTQTFIVKKSFIHFDGNRRNVGDRVVMRINPSTDEKLRNGYIEPMMTPKEVKAMQADPVVIEPVEIKTSELPPDPLKEKKSVRKKKP